MKRIVLISMSALCVVALCLQGCPGSINQLQTEYHQGLTNVIWLYSPADSVYITSYLDILTNPKKTIHYHIPDSCFAMQYEWQCPWNTDPVPYDEKYHALHLRKLSNRDTTFVITDDPNFYLNGVKCHYKSWIIPQYLHGEPDSLRSMYSFRQIIDSLRVHYPHLVTIITDTEEHIFDEMQIPNSRPRPGITIE